MTRRVPCITLTPDLIGKRFVKIDGRTIGLADSIGFVQARDVGKRGWLNDGVLSFENDEQLAARIAERPRVEIGKTYRDGFGREHKIAGVTKVDPEWVYTVGAFWFTWDGRHVDYCGARGRFVHTVDSPRNLVVPPAEGGAS